MGKDSKHVHCKYNESYTRKTNESLVLSGGKGPYVGSSGRAELKNCVKRSRKLRPTLLVINHCYFSLKAIRGFSDIKKFNPHTKKFCYVGDIIASIL